METDATSNAVVIAAQRAIEALRDLKTASEQHGVRDRKLQDALLRALKTKSTNKHLMNAMWRLYDAANSMPRQ